MRSIRAFLASRSGNFAIFGAILSVPLVLSAGLAVDYARYVSSSKHLQEIADAAALALAASKERNQAKLETMAAEIVESNRNPSRLETVAIASLDATADSVDLKLNGDIPATFMGIVGHDRLPSVASALAERAVTGNVEVALILDNTWSMDRENKGKKKIATLKTAATGLVNELMQTDDGIVRIGLVPYADYVNVGTENRGQSWLDVPADFTTTPSQRTCSMRNTRSVCDKEKPKATCTRVVDGTPETYSCGGGCEPGHSRVVQVEPYEVCSGGGTGTTYQWYGCVGSRRTGDNRLHDNNPSVRYPGYLDTRHTCPTPIVPLASKRQPLVKAVNDMVINRGTYYRPYTYIPAGLIWGLNVLSPGHPFKDAGEYDANNVKPRKVAVLMTDGENTLRFDPSNGRHIGKKDAESEDDWAALLGETNDDAVAICDFMKTKNIEIYTVAFMVSDAAAKTMLESCATSPSHYYDATDSDALLAAFTGIGQSLRVVRLAR